MARIRTIKPGYFKNADLFDAEQETKLPLRVAYAGLWTIADREGRFKWKPREIKTDVLPYDEVDMKAVLDALVRYNFILKYKVAGEEYGLIPKFLEHQHVNKNEAPSTIPAPSQNNNSPSNNVSAPTITVAAPSEHHEEGKGTGRERKGREGEEQDDDEAHAREPTSDPEDGPPSEPIPDTAEQSKPLLARVCEILRINLHADPERITWHRQIQEMLRDGLTEAQIIRATETARTRGKINLAYIRTVAFNPPKTVGNAHETAKRESSLEQAARVGAELIAELQASDGSSDYREIDGATDALRQGENHGRRVEIDSPRLLPGPRR